MKWGQEKSILPYQSGKSQGDFIYILTMSSLKSYKVLQGACVCHLPSSTLLMQKGSLNLLLNEKTSYCHIQCFMWWGRRLADTIRKPTVEMYLTHNFLYLSTFGKGYRHVLLLNMEKWIYLLFNSAGVTIFNSSFASKSVLLEWTGVK